MKTWLSQGKAPHYYTLLNIPLVNKHWKTQFHKALRSTPNSDDLNEAKEHSWTPSWTETLSHTLVFLSEGLRNSPQDTYLSTEQSWKTTGKKVCVTSLLAQKRLPGRLSKALHPPALPCPARDGSEHNPERETKPQHFFFRNTNMSKMKILC